MSNDLVSQPVPVSGSEMAQFEHISSNLEQQMQMGFMPFGTSESLCQQMSLSDLEIGQMDVFSHSESDQMSISDSQNVFFDPLLSQHGLELMPTSDQASGQVKHDSYGHGMQQHAVATKPVGGMGSMVHGVRPLQEISMLSKRKVPMESSNSPALQKLSVPNKRMAQMEHRPWLQPSSSFNKRTVQMHSPPTSLTSPNLPTATKRANSNKSATSVSKSQTLQMQPSPKAKQESFESVRSKMRDSLAAALALVNEEKGQASDAEKSWQTKAAADDERKQGDIFLTESVSASDVVSGLTVGNHQEMCSSPQDAVDNRKDNDILRVSKCGEQDSKSSNILRDADVLFSDNIFARDELLQGNGLSWALDRRMVPDEKREKPENETAGHVDKAQLNQTPEVLAFKIEGGLFKLFGGVNKKYKEKGRSLLFNLKDRSNPELRESVMSGKISPDRLCSMSAEELASKELSEWRQAKAEELAQMVVLPDTDVDLRRFVKKTHKGEFQVEFEQSDNSVEVSAGVAMHDSQQPSTGAKPEMEVKPKTVTKRRTQVQAASKAEAVYNKAEAASVRNKAESQGALSSVTVPSREGADVMQGFDDEMKDSAFLPPIVSLDEFMESLDSEPPFDSLPNDADAFTPGSGKAAIEVDSESKSPVKAPEGCADVGLGNPKTADADSDKAKSDDVPVKNEAEHHISTLKGERVWEGSVQLSVTTAMPMVAIFKSGEKTATKEWVRSVEIKGRVRLDAFEKFLQELRMSRSRAVMVVHLASMEDTHKQKSLKEVADSYMSDGRVGFGEPCSGVELYFCPPHSKMLEVLAKIVPKDQLDSLNAIDNGLIGVVVWRRAQIISPNSSSHHKQQHAAKRQQQQQHPSSRRQDSSFNANFSSPRHSVPPKPQHVVDNDDDCDDVPPGFGPGAASRDEDDLPEFNFLGGSKLPRHSRHPTQQGLAVAAPARPVDEVRQLIQKYGQPQPQSRPQPQPNSRSSSTHAAMQPWNDDDDDIPEWQPQTAQLRHAAASHGFPMPLQQPLPPAMNIHGQLNAAQPWQQQGHFRPAPSQNSGHFYGAGQPSWR